MFLFTYWNRLGLFKIFPILFTSRNIVLLFQLSDLWLKKIKNKFSDAQISFIHMQQGGSQIKQYLLFKLIYDKYDVNQF